jgi:hypothetical protein
MMCIKGDWPNYISFLFLGSLCSRCQLIEKMRGSLHMRSLKTVKTKGEELTDIFFWRGKGIRAKRKGKGL